MHMYPNYNQNYYNPPPKMELERQFYLDFPYNREFDHLPISSSRLMRNFAEKMRRDKLNKYISELSSLVPIVAMATKRMDKTSVLRLSANFLRIHLSLKQNSKQNAPETITRPVPPPEALESNLSTILLDSLEGFMLIVTSSGKIVYVSDSVEKLLGHSQLDLMGQSLYTVCHNGDHELLRHHLQPTQVAEDKGDTEGDQPTIEYVPRSPSFFGGNPEDALSGLASGERRSFYVRLAERSMARGDPQRHVTVHLIGLLRPPQNKKDPNKGHISKGKKECSSTTSNDEYMLVCVARPFRNKGITELSLMEAVQDEYVTRHLPDGRIIYSDHRIAFVAGYLTEEVMGLSAFHFIHQDDLPWATVANRQMFSSVEGQGYSVYRLRSKTGSLIHLKTRGYLEFNKTTQKVETFVCINTLLTPEEGDKELEKERDRITPFITFQQVTTTSTNGGVHGGRSSTTTTTTTTTGSGNALLSPQQQQQIQQALQSVGVPIPVTAKLMNSTASSSFTSASPGALLDSSTQQQQQQQASSNQMMALAPPPPSIAASSSNSPASYVEVLEASSEDRIGDVMLSSPSVLMNAQTNGDSNTNHQISSPSVTSLITNHQTSNSNSVPSPLQLDLLDGGANSLDQQLSQDNSHLVSLSPPVLMASNIGGKRVIVTSGAPPDRSDLIPRLKRSRIFAHGQLPDVDDLMTSSAKRSIPTAFISSYSTLHHMSPHLNNKWTTDKNTTIIYDQHNNNG